MSQSYLSEARLTHIALESGDLDRTIEFYTSLTPLVVVDEFADADGRSVWLSNPKQWQTPFILVFVSFNKVAGSPRGVLHPFSHVGIEVPSRGDVNAVADRAREMGSLYWEPRDRGAHAVRDPDGNIVEISHNQRIFEAVNRLWNTNQ